MKKLLLMLLLLPAVLVTHAQVKVSGKISDANNAPIAGATVKEKGTKNGTSADANGNFTLTVSTGAKLVISAVGFEAKEVAAADNVAVLLVTESKNLSEVVVTGVGVATSKKKLGISVESVTADKLPPAPTASIDQALIGKIAGAQISSTSGSLGAKAAIVLRGINTIQRGTTPMILMDGLEVGVTDLNTLDLSSIERVEVVQGAASASLYGAQGANGVIQLFSKKGKQGQTNIDISSSITTNDYLNIGGLRKAKLHGYKTNANNEVIGASGNPITFDPVLGIYSENLIWASTDPTNKTDKPYDKNFKYYDHFNEFFQKAPTYNNSITIYGGREKLDFNFSFSNNHQVSNLRNNGYLNRTNFTSNIGVEIAKNLRFRSTTQLAYTKNTTTLYDRTAIYSLNNTRAFADYSFKDADGNYAAHYGDAAGVNGSNPNYELQYHDKRDNKVDLVQGFNLNYKFPKFVELDAKYGLNYSRRDVRDWIKNQTGNKNINLYDPNPANDGYHVYGNDIPISGYALTRYVTGNTLDYQGELDNYYFNNFFQNFLATTTLRTDFERDFHINVPIKTSTQVSFDYRKSELKEYYTYGYGLPPYEPFTNAEVKSTTVKKDQRTPFVTYGYLVNQRFEYGEIAGVSAGFRTDYSSAFGKGSKPFTFPRADAYVRLSSLNFWQNSKLNNSFTEFKLRAAYGKAGIQPTPFDRYVTLATAPLGEDVVFYSQATQPNPDLNVEVSKEFEIGTDMIFKLLRGSHWLNSANFSVTYWDRSSEAVIYTLNSAPSSGIGGYKDNAFSLGANGVQASLGIGVFNSKKVNWNFTANFGKQSSKILSITGPPVVVLSSAGSTGYVLKPGEKIGQLFGYLALHSVDEKGPDGQPYISKEEQSQYTVASNGWVVNKATKQPYFTPLQYSFGDPNPKFNISFINDFTFKDFVSLSFQWDWLSGSHLYNQTKEWLYRDGIHSDYEKQITIDGQTGAWTAFYRGVYAVSARNGTKNYFYEDASFLRLRNVSVAVDVAKAFHIKGFKKLQLVLSGRNLVTITDYTGMDPEVSSANTTGSGNSAFDRGVDHNTLPNLKSFTAGINIGF